MPDENPRTALLDLSIEPGPTTTISLVGELDPATAPILDKATTEVASNPDVQRLVLDLSGLSFLDSSGLRVLVTAREALNERGAELVLRAPSANTQRLLDVTGLGEIIAVE